MAELKRKVKYALDEGRILLLGSQVLVGFGFRSVFETGFDVLPVASQYLKLVSLALMTVTTGMLMSPAARHRLATGGQDTPGLHGFTTRALAMALPPFACAFAIDIGIVVHRLLGTRSAIAAGTATALVAIVCWYAWPALQRRPPWRRSRVVRPGAERQPPGGTPLGERIDHVLTEARMIPPGVQALLGFQLAAMLTDGFDHLPQSSKYVHFGGLALIAIAMVLLMTPAAYHRLVEDGEETPRFHRVASTLMMLALVPLGLGIAAALFLVTRKITEHVAIALLAGLTSLAFFYGLWFALPAFRRWQVRSTTHPTPTPMRHRDAA
jgi:hypothetical protein